jgi:hypothetical protein
MRPRRAVSPGRNRELTRLIQKGAACTGASSRLTLPLTPFFAFLQCKMRASGQIFHRGTALTPLNWLAATSEEKAMRINKATALAAVLAFGFASAAMAQGAGSPPPSDQAGSGAQQPANGSGSSGAGVNNGASSPGATNSSSGGYQETAPNSANPNGNAPAGAQQHQ